MNCAYCDSNFESEANFCSNCGAATGDKEGVVASSSRARQIKDATAKTARVAGSTAVETAKFVGSTAKEGLKSDMGKSIATCAALGAVIAMPIPFVGSALGASVGAIIGAVRKF